MVEGREEAKRQACGGRLRWTRAGSPHLDLDLLQGHSAPSFSFHIESHLLALSSLLPSVAEGRRPLACSGACSMVLSHAGSESLWILVSAALSLALLLYSLPIWLAPPRKQDRSSDSAPSSGRRVKESLRQIFSF